MKKTKSLFFIIVFMLSITIISAGVGIKWSQESVLVNEGERTCLTYSVYNPWPEDSYVEIGLSDEVKDIMITQESEAKLIPANTKSISAIPIEFCFKVPVVYQKDCWLAGRYVCKQECKEQPKIYNGEVIVKSVPAPTEIGGAGGSVATMSVSAPIKITVRCNVYSRDFTLIYIILAIIALIVVITILYKKYRKPKIERDREKLKELKEAIRKENQKRKK